MSFWPDHLSGFGRCQWSETIECRNQAVVIVKERYMGIVKMLCSDHLVYELGVPFIDLLCKEQHSIREQVLREIHARAEEIRSAEARPNKSNGKNVRKLFV